MTIAGNATAGKADIYQFIKTNGGISAANTNNDDKVSYSELESFLTKGDFSKEEIALFWKDANTNTNSGSTNSLDANEMKVIMCKSEAADQMKIYAEEMANKYFQQINNALTGINIKQDDWTKKFVQAFNNDSIMNAIANDNSIDPTKNSFSTDVTTKVRRLMDQAMNTAIMKATANTVRDAILETVETKNKDLFDKLSKDFDYDFSKDSVLTAKIESIINGITGNVLSTAENGTISINSDVIGDIQDKIQTAVYSYLKLAGISDYPQGFTPVSGCTVEQGNTFTDLQRVVLKQKLEKPIETKVAELAKQYEDFGITDDDLKKAIDAYVTKQLDRANPSTYFSNGVANDSAIEGILTGLEDSAEFKNAIKEAPIIALFTKDSSGNSKILDEIGKLIGTESGIFTTLEKQDLLSFPKIVDLIKSTASSIDIDKFNADKVAAEIAKTIVTNLTDYISGISEGMKVDDIASIYESRINTSTRKSDADAKKALTEFAAYYYKKGDDWKTAVIDVFGDNYTNAINGLLHDQIETKFTELKDKLVKVVDTDTLKDKFDADATWSGLSASATTSATGVKSETDEEYLERLKSSATQFVNDVNDANPWTFFIVKGKIEGIDFFINAINSATTKEQVENAVKEIEEAVGATWKAPERIVGNESSVTSSDGVLTFNLKPGQTITGINIKPKFNGITLDTSKESQKPKYYESSNSSYVTIDENGNVTIKCDDTDVNTEVKITIKIGGKEIDSKTIRIVTGQFGASTLTSENRVGITDSKGQVVPLSELLANGSQHSVMLGGFIRNGDSSLANTKKAAITAIESLLKKLGDDLEKAGYNKAKVQNAVETTTNYYKAAINAMTDQEYSSGDHGVHSNQFYYENNGQLVPCSDSYYQLTRHRESDANDNVNAGWYVNNTSQVGGTGTGLLLSESYASTNTYRIDINLNVLVSNFMRFMV